ncbi:MAG: tryptophan-rich sensory protein [Anaerolineae bacterium]|nr:tryptophan-rich sensory protein [Anaerolineae bacterium]
MNRDFFRQFINIVALVFVLVMNGLSEAIPLNGQTSAQISNRLPIFFVPANYVFGVWGVIYTLLIVFVIYQALPSQRENPYLRKIGYWFALTCVANGVWLVLFHYNQFALSMVAMLILLAALIVIYTRIEIGRGAVSNATRWCIQIPFSTYLGWITVATVANAAYVLYDAKWNGFGISGEVWAAIMLVVATVITLTIIVNRRDVAYTAVLLWALVGIVIKQSAAPLVAGTAGVVAVVILLTLIWRLVKGQGGNATKLTPVRA